MGLFMAGDNTAVIIPFAANDMETNVSAPPEPFATEILQGVFASKADRDAFLQAVTMHGVTFLRCADAPLSAPTIKELTTIERLALAISRLWPRPSVEGGKND
jgi:hypothetical protein